MIKDDEIIGVLEEKQRLEHEITQYFRNHSQLWKAIVDYIRKSKPYHCVLGEKRHSVQYHSCSSGVSFRRAFAKPAGAYPYADSTLRLDIDVSFYDNDNDREYSEHWTIDVPIDLVDCFTQEKFDKWIYSKLTEFYAKQEEKDVETIRDIVKRNPQVFTKLFEEKKKD